MAISIYIDARSLPDELRPYFSGLLQRRIAERVDASLYRWPEVNDPPQACLWLELRMDPGLGEEGYRISRAETLNQARRMVIEGGGQHGYFRDLPMYRVELCPSNPQGFDLLLRWRREVFAAFADLPLSYVWVWPYDQGGCGCRECASWGGFGANPLPEYLRKMWAQAGPLQAGGFPYSEGIFEDLNKAIMAAFYWNGDGDYEEVIREYANFYLSSRSKAQVLEAAQLLETTNRRERWQDGRPQWMPETAEATGDEQFVIARPQKAEQAFHLLEAIDRQLPPRQRRSWRWRIISLRGLIDCELVHNDYRISDRCEAAFEELIRLYHAEDALWAVRPPSRRGRVIGWD